MSTPGCAKTDLKWIVEKQNLFTSSPDKCYHFVGLKK